MSTIQELEKMLQGVIEATPALQGPSRDQAQLLETLAALSDRTVSDDAVNYEGNVFTVPTTLRGQSSKRISETLKDILDAANEKTALTRDFPYHPYDVAAAVGRVLDKYFGLRAVGQQWTSVTIGPNGETADVPYATTVEIPQLGGELRSEFTVDYSIKKPIGQVAIRLPRRLTAQAHGLFEAVGAELKTGSLFRGKAIDANWAAPSFNNPFAVDRSKIVYTRETEVQLSANLWSVLRHREMLAAMGTPARRAVLLPGPYGTGKSLGALATAQEALGNGWTFIQVKPKQDLEDAFVLAKLYAPAVVFVEDIDARADTDTDGDELAKILDIFDGIDRKAAGDIVVVVTTNHIERIHKGMLRPGRLDAIINIERPDAEAIERLVKVTSPVPIEGDFDAIVESMRDYTPAFIVEAVGRTVRYAIDRTNGGLPDWFTSEEIVKAANGLRSQYELMIGSVEKPAPTLDTAFKDVVTEVAEESTKKVLTEAGVL